MAQNPTSHDFSESGVKVDIHLGNKNNEGEKLNKCSQCDYATTRAGYLRRHLKTHTGEKSNKCSPCDYAICILSSTKFLFRQVILWGHIFCSYIQVLGIRYFQRQCALYHCHIFIGSYLFAIIYKYKVLGIFKGHALHIIVIYRKGRIFCSDIQVLGIRYFKGHALQIIVIYQKGHIFCSYIQVLGIRYFQRPCAPYHCLI